MKPLLPLITLFLLSPFVIAQQKVTIDKTDENRIDSVGHLYLSTNRVPGMGIGVVKNDKVLYSKGLGIKDKSTNEPVADQTVFHMASVSKPFVSTAILILAEQQKLNINDLVTEHLPYFKMADNRYKDITIEQLLLHTSGIPDVGPSENYDWDKPQYDDEALERYVKGLETWKLDFKPGRKKPSYTNTGYEVLGDIVAKASGQSFEDYVKESILTPNDMSNSSFLLSDIPKDLLSSPHVLNSENEVVVSGIYPYNRIHAPSSCLHSNIEDMLKFAITNLNKGMYKDSMIFSEETYTLLTEPQVRENKIFQYGLGWNVAPYRDTERIEFTGGDIGFDTVIIMVPSADFGIVILTNGDYNPPAFDVINTAYDIASKY